MPRTVFRLRCLHGTWAADGTHHWARVREFEECGPRPPSLSSVNSHKTDWLQGAPGFISLWNPKEHLAGKRFATGDNVKRAVTSWIDIWHRIVRRDTSPDTTVGQTVQLHSRLSKGLTCTICYPCVVCTMKPEYSQFSASKGLLPHFLRLVTSSGTAFMPSFEKIHMLVQTLLQRKNTWTL